MFSTLGLSIGFISGYILAESNGGLSNRLRVLASYIHVGQANYAGAHLVFIWDVNQACPGHFLEVFKPIPGNYFFNQITIYLALSISK